MKIIGKKFIILFSAVLIISGCGSQNNTGGLSAENNKSQQSNQADNLAGGTDADGFVRLPGEPSRGDDAYYLAGEICAQFTKEYMEGIIGKTILEAKPSYAEMTNCQYSLAALNQYGQAPNILLSLSFLPVANQVKGHEMMDRTVAPDSSIPMDNYVVKQENGLINEIYFVLGPNKFLSLNRSSATVASEEEILEIAKRIGDKIKNFK